jgi:aspartate racemase
MKTLGLIGGLSWESTAVYYRLLNEGAKERLGGLHSAKLVLWSFEFSDVAALQSAGEWEQLTGMMIDAAQRLERAGAEALVICANTMHKMAPQVAQSVSIPLIHIADATAIAIMRTAARRPALLATRYTMEQDFYKGRLKEHGIDALVPGEPDRTRLHRIIYDELCQGIVRPDSKKSCLEMIATLRRGGADGVILGCTELGMILSQADLDLPVFDTCALHAQAAIDFAIGRTAAPVPAAGA